MPDAVSGETSGNYKPHDHGLQPENLHQDHHSNSGRESLREYIFYMFFFNYGNIIHISAPKFEHKRMLSAGASDKITSQEIAAKHMLRILVEKNIIKDTGQLIYNPIIHAKYYPKNASNILQNTEPSKPREVYKVFDETLKLTDKSFLNYSNFIHHGQSSHYKNILNDAISCFQKITIRQIHNSSHDDIGRKLADVRSVEDKIAISFDSSRKKRRKIEKIKITNVSDVAANVCKEPTAVEKGKLKDMRILADSKDEKDLLKEGDDMNITQKDLELIEKKYPQPRGMLNNIYAFVANELKNSQYRPEISYKVSTWNINSNDPMWKCTYKLRWPHEAAFSSVKTTKALAAKDAALKALHWLQIQKKLTMSGAPKLHDMKEVKDISRIPVEVTIDPAVIHDLDNLITYYNKHIAYLIDNPENSEKMSECSDNWKSDEDSFTEDEDSGSIEMSKSSESWKSDEDSFMEDDDSGNIENLFGKDELINPITGFNFMEPNSQIIDERNKLLYNRYLQRARSDERREDSKVLPILKF
ncbi:hypothetical protein L9F63_023010, partial [Diploptera punctata]